MTFADAAVVPMTCSVAVFNDNQQSWTRCSKYSVITLQWYSRKLHQHWQEVPSIPRHSQAPCNLASPWGNVPYQIRNVSVTSTRRFSRADDTAGETVRHMVHREMVS
jgi:hypothetical protein